MITLVQPECMTFFKVFQLFEYQNTNNNQRGQETMDGNYANCIKGKHRMHLTQTESRTKTIPECFFLTRSICYRQLST